ncbi:MAG: 50S ribosomal protein L11 methyltransferase [Rhodospirillales bacterium]|nr:50S ribosomal protein L11 methyltransferase [Rhodospirillales bacterium]
MKRPAGQLETVFVDVPPSARDAYEAAFASVCRSVGLFHDEARGMWRVEGVKDAGEGDAALDLAVALAAAATGTAVPLRRRATETGGWLARVYAGFPEQRVGRFALRGTHLPPARTPGVITLVLDAGVAFGSGEHGSTRGCLWALEHLAPLLHPSRWRGRILDLGTGSGVLAMAASALLRRRTLATDNDPWAVRAARENARRNRVAVRTAQGDGWNAPAIRHAGRFDLVFANILARPLCRMARDLARHLAPGGVAVLAGLTRDQARMVLAAHRGQGLLLKKRHDEGRWTTLIVAKPDA